MLMQPFFDIYLIFLILNKTSWHMMQKVNKNEEGEKVVLKTYIYMPMCIYIAVCSKL